MRAKFRYYFYHISNLLASWSLLLAMIGFAKTYLTFTNAFNQYANEAVLPFYIMHQTALVCFGYFAVRMHMHDFFKWGIIVAVSFSICMGLYEFVIRKTDLLRFLFGMKTTAKAFQVMRHPIPQILIVLLFISPAILALANQSKSKAIFSDLKLPRVHYSYDGNPSFSFSYPAKSREVKKKEFPSQVLSMKTPFGKMFLASVSDVPSDIPLSDYGPKVLFGILTQKGSHHQLIKNQPITLNDGTVAYKTVFSKVSTDGTRHVIISVSTYEKGKCISVMVDTWKDPKDVEWIVNSLVFDT